MTNHIIQPHTKTSSSKPAIYMTIKKPENVILLLQEILPLVLNVIASCVNLVSLNTFINKLILNHLLHLIH